MKHLLLIGACYLDTILSVPRFPEEDSKLRATALQHRRGGNCANTLHVLHQLLSAADPTTSITSDVRLHLVSSLPDSQSAATTKILSSFGTGADIDLSRCLYRQGHHEAASSYIIRSQVSGSRTIVNFNDLPEMTVNEFTQIADGFADQHRDEQCWWHFEGRIPETTLECIHNIRQLSSRWKVSVEVEKPNREGLRQLAEQADAVFYSKAWAEYHGYQSAEACLNGETSLRGTLRFCTWGAGGASAVIHGQPAVSVPTRPLKNPVLDTVGAGDTFVAGILYGHVCYGDNLDTHALLRFAVDLATTKVQRDGFDGVVAEAGWNPLEQI